MSYEVPVAKSGKITIIDRERLTEDLLGLHPSPLQLEHVSQVVALVEAGTPPTLDMALSRLCRPMHTPRQREIVAALVRRGLPDE